MFIQTASEIHVNKGRIADISRKAKYVAGIDPTLEKTCESCLFLPTCGGGCPGKRMQNKYENGKYHVCTYFKGENEIKDYLDIHYTIQKMKHDRNNSYFI